jgi:hypothetical protein
LVGQVERAGWGINGQQVPQHVGHGKRVTCSNSHCLALHRIFVIN